MQAAQAPLLEARNLSVSFQRYREGITRSPLTTIRGLNLSVGAGELVAVVGSSGSGKSLLAHAILGILPYNASWSGELLYRGRPLDQRRQEQLRGREIVLVPQSTSYLDPLMKVGAQIRRGRRDREAREQSAALLRRYELKPEVEERYPFQLSGGMTRRVLISTAVMDETRLIIADEPTPGLHMSLAKRVMSHFRELADRGAGVLVITHDLELALETADRVAVFYGGTTVEEAPAACFQEGAGLLHPYSKALWNAMPGNGFRAIRGEQPDPGEIGEGCVFAPRCPRADELCRGRGEIPYRSIGQSKVLCVHPEEGNA